MNMSDNCNSIDSLIILGCGITALSIARNAKRNGLKTIIFDNKVGVAHASLHTENYYCPEKEEQCILSCVLQFGNKKNALICATDDWLYFTKRNRTILEKMYGVILHPSNNILEILLNKIKFSEVLIKTPFYTPVLYTKKEAMEYLKADSSHKLMLRTITEGKKKPFKALEIKNIECLKHWVEKLEFEGFNYVITESLLGKKLIQYSVGIASKEMGIRTITCVKRRPLPRQCKVGSVFEKINCPEAEKIGTELVKKLDYFGIGEIEMLYDSCSKKFYIIEFNARPWMQYSMTYLSGNDFLNFLLHTRKNEDVARNSQINWINMKHDIKICFSRSRGLLRSRDISYFEYFKSILRANTYAVFDPSDLGPFLFSLGILRARYSIIRTSNIKK
jgi:predicted ATP-grasp superfamily ATP-dependent carboligase